MSRTDREKKGDEQSNSPEKTDLTRITIVKGDITKQQVEAIVTAANRFLLGGGGVDGAVHQAAGPQLMEDCRRFGGCEPGDAKITPGYNLPAGFVIHAVGPVYFNNTPEKAAQLLASCYQKSLELCDENGLKTVAFPSISTGAYGYPIDDAVQIVHDTVDAYITAGTNISEIRFVTHSDRDFKAYQQTFPDAAVM